MKSILIVGGAGYVGSHVCRELTKKNYHLVILDNLTSGFKENIDSLDNTTFIKGSIDDVHLLDEIFTQYDIINVFHFAAFINVGESTSNPKKYYDNNVIKTITLINTMLKHQCKNFIFSSTAAVYGQPEYLPIDTNHPISPINPYGNSKYMIEIILKDYKDAYDLNYGILRYFNVCGAAMDGSLGDRKYPAQHLVPILLYAIKEEKDFFIFGDDYDTADGTCIRDYIHIDDLSQAHLLSLEYLINKNQSHLVNLGTQKAYSVKEIIDLSKKVTKKDVQIKVAKRRDGDPSQLYADYKKANEILNWSPKYNIEDIVESSWRWICSLSKE